MIEDRTEDALLVRKHLAACGDFGLHWVVDGEEALRYLRREGEFTDVASPDIILLDLKLPGRMDGFTFLEWCRNEGPDRAVPVVVMTVSPLPQDMRRAQKLGVKSYLTKPVDWKRFGEEISGLAAGELVSPFVKEPAARLMQRPRLRKVAGVLTLLDGKKVTVRAASQFEDEEVPFRYDGDTALFKPFAPSGTLGFFKWYLESMAANLGADMEFFEER